MLEDLTYHEPKAEQLETLKELGIDVSFLDAFEPGAAQRVENIQSLLDYIADVIPKLRNGSENAFLRIKSFFLLRIKSLNFKAN